VAELWIALGKIGGLAMVGGLFDLALRKAEKDRISNWMTAWWYRFDSLKWRNFGKAEAAFAIELIDRYAGKSLWSRRRWRLSTAPPASQRQLPSNHGPFHAAFSLGLFSGITRRTIPGECLSGYRDVPHLLAQSLSSHLRDVPVDRFARPHRSHGDRTRNPHTAAHCQYRARHAGLWWPPTGSN